MKKSRHSEGHLTLRRFSLFLTLIFYQLYTAASLAGLALCDSQLHVDGSEQECYNCKKADLRKSYKKIDKAGINKQFIGSIEY